jgi:beta-phosphoglucomutase
VRVRAQRPGAGYGDSVRQPRAILFDFNGTLSDDEQILSGIYAEILAGEKRQLAAGEYEATLAGHTDEAIFSLALDLDPADPRVADLTRRRIALYRARTADGATISAETRLAVHRAAHAVPVGIVSAAAREEILPALAAAGLADVLDLVVAADDVTDGKPAPDCYQLGLVRLRSRTGIPFAPDEVLAIEDTEAGVAAARAAGLRCIAVAGTMPAHRLGAAESVAARLGDAVHAALRSA